MNDSIGQAVRTEGERGLNMKARFCVDVEFDGHKTDAESIATALDKVLSNGLAVLLGCWDEYGGEPKIGEFFVSGTDADLRHADDLCGQADDPDDEVEMRWHNFYRCPDCGGEWGDCWDSQCDDDCPHCGCRHVSPYESKEVEEG